MRGPIVAVLAGLSNRLARIARRNLCAEFMRRQNPRQFPRLLQSANFLKILVRAVRRVEKVSR